MCWEASAMNDDAQPCEPFENHPEGLPCLTKEGILVRSRSDPEVVHVVRKEGTRWICDCKGYLYKGICRHVREAERLEQAKSSPSSFLSCSDCVSCCKRDRICESFWPLNEIENRILRKEIV